MDAVKIAQQNPDKEIVFFAVGFETTAPANAMSVHCAKQSGVTNYSVLVSHVLVPPAMEAILGSPTNCVQGFLAAGHVCTVMGYTEYEPIALKYRVPIVVTGFEPLDLLQGIYMCLLQLEQGRCEVENQYAHSVRREGNQPDIRVREEVAGACEILGLDPLYLANEGRFVAFVPEQEAERAVAILQSVNVSSQAARIGRVVDGPAGLVTLKTQLGTERIVDMLSGEQLPRIC